MEIVIDGLGAGGDGVGRAPDGRVVFVPFTAPGDRVRVRIDREHRRFVNARVESLVEASSQRADPACAVFGSCGGCAWQHVAYSAQVAAKAKIVTDALTRIARIRVPGAVETVPSPAAYGYRIRARVLVEGGKVGFRRRRSHALCATNRCPILAAPLQQCLAELSRRTPLSDGEWELFCGEGEARAILLPSSGGERIELRVAGERVGISPGVFAQSNGLLQEALANAVLAAAGRGGLALEWFAGAGFFTLGLARRFDRVVALESDSTAIRDLAANVRSAGLANVELLPETLEVAFQNGSFRGMRPEVVVVDPPRRGLPTGFSDALDELAPRRIVYLSCDSATQARDAAYLRGVGYSLERVQAFDLFPQTPHVESLAIFERDGFTAR